MPLQHRGTMTLAPTMTQHPFGWVLREGSPVGSGPAVAESGGWHAYGRWLVSFRGASGWGGGWGSEQAEAGQG